MPTESELKEPEPESPTIAQQAADESVPFRAVVTLLSALRYRHPATADHCQRVADLCLATAEGLMSPQQRYLLEVAALLHDVGKLGVPDAILLKPNRLSESELRVMRTYEQIGVDIVATAFPSPELADIVRHHHAWFGVNPNDSRGLSGEDIPLGSRILFIAEAYDSMIADQAYRPGRSHEEAVAELRRCAGSQFDPEITERFIRTVESLNQRSNGEESGIARQAALCVGLEIEKLACALDAKDASTLASMAATLKTTAAQNGFEEIAEVAGRLQNRAASPRQDEEESWIENLRLGADLLELCRTTQASLITRADHSGNGAPPPGDHHSVAATSVS